MMNPIEYKMIPAISRLVPKAGWGNCVTLGELRIVTGKEQVHTQNVWLENVSLQLSMET
jgi:hypothetical protein